VVYFCVIIINKLLCSITRCSDLFEIQYNFQLYLFFEKLLISIANEKRQNPVKKYFYQAEYNTVILA